MLLRIEAAFSCKLLHYVGTPASLSVLLNIVQKGQECEWLEGGKSEVTDAESPYFALYE
jgi:hypothetical protein